MTEKRFTLELYEGTKQIKAFKDNGKIIYPLNLVELMNELHEENQALKSDRARYEEECRLDVFKELMEENEQLKKENKELRQYLCWQEMELVEMEDLNE